MHLELNVNEFEAKRKAALRLLKSTGMKPSNYCPPYLRLLWRLGVEIPPPHFARFALFAAMVGLFSAVGYGGLMWLMVWRDVRTSLLFPLAAVAFGVFFGLVMALHYARERKKHGLPAWDELQSSEDKT